MRKFKKAETIIIKKIHSRCYDLIDADTNDIIATCDSNSSAIIKCHVHEKKYTKANKTPILSPGIKKGNVFTVEFCKHYWRAKNNNKVVANYFESFGHIERVIQNLSPKSMIIKID